MSFERALLWSLGLMLLLFGIGYLVSPVSMLALTGASASAPAEITDVRATYGGFQIGVGALLIWSALAPPRLSSGLFSLGLAAGSVGLCRLVGLIVDGDFGPVLFMGPIHISALAFELAASALAFVGFARVRTVPSTQDV